MRLNIVFDTIASVAILFGEAVMLKIRLKYVFLIFVVLCQMLGARDLKIVYASRMRDVLGARDAEYARLATLLKKYRKTDI